MPSVKIARTLPTIPPEPTPTREQVEAELQRRIFAKSSVPDGMKRHMAEFFCYAE
jgi:hypothetical protein